MYQELALMMTAHTNLRPTHIPTLQSLLALLSTSQG